MWFKKNPWNEAEDRAYTGPGLFTFGSNFNQTRHSSWTHDGEYIDEKNPYVRFNKADHKWMQNVDPRDPIGWLGKGYFNIKRVVTGAFDELYPTNRRRVNSMPKRAFSGGSSFSKRKGSMLQQYRGGKRARVAARSRGGTVGTAAIRKVLDSTKEKKFHDVSHVIEVMGDDTTPNIDSVIVGISQNASSEGRIGIDLWLKSLQIKGFVKRLLNDENSQAHVARVMVVIDRQSNGTAPTLAQILDLGAGNDVLAFRKLENTARFTFLMDKVVTMNPQASYWNDTVGRNSPISKPFGMFKSYANGLHVKYQTGTPGLEADIMDNNIWVVAFGEDGVELSIEWESRMRYTD